MNAEEKQALIEWFTLQIHKLETACDEIPFGLDTDDALLLQAMHATLAALTAQPVRLPKVRNSFGPMGSVYLDEVITAIRTAGYEVQE